MNIADCKLIELPRLTDERGSLSVIEGMEHIPFDIKRIYYIYDAPYNAVRGGLAYRNAKYILVAVSGSFTVYLDDGEEKTSFLLDSPHKALYIPEMIWRGVSGFSDNAVCLAISSVQHRELSMIRDYQEFLAIKHKTIDT